jgi:U3 small nucleolar RNA-associated protein 14
LDEDDLKKILQAEDIKEDEALLSKFLIENNENKKEFFEETFKKDNSANDGFTPGWGSWAGESKNIQAKEFLRKKRYEQTQLKRQQLAKADLSIVKMNNSHDKKVKNNYFNLI